MRQGQFESIDDFTYRLEKKSQRIEDSELCKFSAFVNGINDTALKLDIQKSIEINNLTNYAEDVNLAKNLENYRIAARHPTTEMQEQIGINQINNNFRKYSTSSGDGPGRGTAPRRRGREGQGGGNGYRRQTAGGMSQIRCFTCQKIGHKSFQCRSSQNGNYRQELSCTICGRKNHSTNNCWSKGKGCKFCKLTNHTIDNCFKLKNKDIRRKVNKILRDHEENEDQNFSDSGSSSESESGNLN